MTVEWNGYESIAPLLSQLLRSPIHPGHPHPSTSGWDTAAVPFECQCLGKGGGEGDSGRLNYVAYIIIRLKVRQEDTRNQAISFGFRGYDSSELL